MSPKSQQQRDAAEKYLKEKVDTLVVRVPKGEKEVIQHHAATGGESVNGFIRRAIAEAMARDQAEGRGTENS